MPGFTKGKWTTTATSKQGIYTITCGERTIARLPRVIPELREEQAANARLIVSAPILNKLLDQALGVIPSNNDRLIDDIAELQNYIKGR